MLKDYSSNNYLDSHQVDHFGNTFDKQTSFPTKSMKLFKTS